MCIFVFFFFFSRAMSSTSGKEQFMKQFDAIVDGVKQNKNKVYYFTTSTIIWLNITYILTKTYNQ